MAAKPKKRRTKRDLFEAAFIRRFPDWAGQFEWIPGHGYNYAWVDGAWTGWQMAVRANRRKR